MTAVPHVRQVLHLPSLELDDDTTLVENAAGMDDEALANNAELERIEAECQELPLNKDDSETWEQELDANVEDPDRKSVV